MVKMEYLVKIEMEMPTPPLVYCYFDKLLMEMLPDKKHLVSAEVHLVNRNFYASLDSFPPAGQFPNPNPDVPLVSLVLP